MDSEQIEQRIIEGAKAKNLHATLLFVDFSKTFNSIHPSKEKKEIAYGIPKETVDAIMMLHTSLFPVLHGDTLAPFALVMHQE